MSTELRARLGVWPWVLCGLALVAASCAAMQGDSVDDALAGGPRVLHILHTNDFHGQVYPREGTWIDRTNPPPVGGANAIAGYVRKARADLGKETVLLVSAGDIFTGTPEGDLTKGQLVMELMNALGYDAMALGNHEFDRGLDALIALKDAATFPILAANVVTKADVTRGEVRGLLASSHLLTRNGIKVGIIGLLAEDTPQITHADARANFSFEDILKHTQAEAAKLREAGAQVILVLSHVGKDHEQPLADAAPPGVVAVLGGHSHTAIDPPYRSKTSGAVYMQTRGKGSAIDHLSLEVGADGVVKVLDAKLVPLMADDWPKDAKVAEIIGRYAPKIEAVMGREVGACAQHVGRTRGADSSPLGNLVTDIMRAKTGVDVAITNKGGIRANLPAGQIRIRELHQVAPFGNTLVTLKMTGAQLTELFTLALAQSKGLEVSGMTVRYIPGKDDSLALSELKVGGEAVTPDATYTIVTNSFLANGGDGHTLLAQDVRVDTGLILRDTLADWFTAQGDKACRHDATRRVHPAP